MLIVAVVMLLLGPDKLPEVAQKLGSSWRALKRIQERVEAEVREVIPDLPSTGDIARIARSPVNMLNQLAERAEARDEATTTAAAAAAAVKETADSTPTSSDDSAFGEALMRPPRATPVVRYDAPPPPVDPSLN